MSSFVNTRRNLFIFGDGGTGKSYLHARMRAHEDNAARVHVTLAATGSAAHLIGGQTIASLFLHSPGITSRRGWYSSKEELFAVLLRQEAGRPYFYRPVPGSEDSQQCPWLLLDTLFIDEISLPDAGMLELINHRLQMARSKRVPFGGVRVVVFGDFGQIPPLPDNGRFASTGLYAFESFSIPAQPAVVRSPWGEAHFLPFELVEQVRAAGDAQHQAVARLARSGTPFNNWPADQKDALTERCFNAVPSAASDVTHLFFANASSKEHNINKNAALLGDVLLNTTVSTAESYTAHLRTLEHVDLWPQAARVMDEAANAAAWASIRAQYDDVPWNDRTDSLAVKPGTKVMLTRNSSVKDGLVNGATGVVVGQGKRSPDSSYRPLIIRLDVTGREHAILPVTETAEFVRHSPTGPWAIIRTDAESGVDGTVVVRLTWTFWPLVYGWALSYNKVQGKTLDAGVVLAISPGVLNNMFYTGLTRSPRLSRVWIVPDLTVTRFYHRGASLLQQAIRADPRFLRFDAAIREQMRQEGAVFDRAFAQLVAEAGRDGDGVDSAEPPAPACIVCQTERANVVILPCAHVTMCQPCDERASRLGISSCALCRGRAEQRVKLFYAN
jgi:hypothetical protein